MSKWREDGGIKFILLEKNTHTFLAAFVGKCWDRTVTVGPNRVIFNYAEQSLANKGGVLWPVRLVSVSKQVSITVKNDFRDLRLNGVNGSDSEQTIIKKITDGSEWTGHAAGGCIVVFRRHSPGKSYDEAFVGSVSGRAQSTTFTVELRIENYLTLNSERQWAF